MTEFSFFKNLQITITRSDNIHLICLVLEMK